MRVIVEVYREAGGRLTGAVHHPDGSRDAFASTLDLLRVLEALDLGRADDRLALRAGNVVNGQRCRGATLEVWRCGHADCLSDVAGSATRPARMKITRPAIATQLGKMSIAAGCITVLNSKKAASR